MAICHFGKTGSGWDLYMGRLLSFASLVVVFLNASLDSEALILQHGLSPIRCLHESLQVLAYLLFQSWPYPGWIWIPKRGILQAHRRQRATCPQLPRSAIQTVLEHTCNDSGLCQPSPARAHLA